MDSFIIRQATSDDVFLIFDLYLQVTAQEHGLARTFQEINLEYICHFSERAQKHGIQLILLDSQNPDNLIGEIHAYSPQPAIFGHLLSELTILIHPKFQKKGLGELLFNTFLNKVIQDFPSILRVELFCRESNKSAIKMYEKLGFIKEGRFENRIALAPNHYEADIPMAWYRNLIK